MSSVVTVKSRQRRMIDFYNLANSKYVLIGRSTAWQDDMYPPMPDETATQIEELIGCKIMKDQWYVKMYVDPTQEERDAAVYYKGHYYYKTLDPVDAVSNGCTAVMIHSILDREELPLVTFRQVGLQVKVANNAETMLPEIFNSLTDKGTLEIIENRKPQTRADDQEEDIYLLVNF